MPCFSPLQGFRGVNGGLTFARHLSTGLPMQTTCGRCIGCRLERSRQWAVRCMHEASLYEDNCFITLTYSDDYLPAFGSLEVRAFQLFMKRLRRRVDRKVRFYHCGEYGDELGRPHYHALLFGMDFADKYPWAERSGNVAWRSADLESLWKFGQSEIGSVTFESAAYVARYITKKITGKAAEDHYRRVDVLTGEISQIQPEYSTMSRRPGIGRGWIEKFVSDVYPSDEVISRGRPAKPPRYYDSYFGTQDPDGLLEVQKERTRRRDRENETPERLSVREVCTVARLNLSNRRLEC